LTAAKTTSPISEFDVPILPINRWHSADTLTLCILTLSLSFETSKTRFNISIWVKYVLAFIEDTKKLRFQYLYEAYKTAEKDTEGGPKPLGSGERNRWSWTADKYQVGKTLNLTRIGLTAL
jgi:hypothetical protein